MEVTREMIRFCLRNLPWGVDEDADMLIDLLREGDYSYKDIATWLFFPDYLGDLEGTPLVLLEEGRSRDVFKEARKMVGKTTV
jgi:hypothetical protein